MAYASHFQIADDIITHLDAVVGGIADPFIQSRYVGFVAISSATVYELAIKDIFCDFGQRTHKVLGTFVSSYFDRINGRIKTDSLKKDYIPRFGDKYLKRFKRKLKETENENLRNQGVSVSSDYNNVIEWRNQFAHEGKVPNTVTYAEITRAYKNGKAVIECLAETMR